MSQTKRNWTWCVLPLLAVLACGENDGGGSSSSADDGAGGDDGSGSDKDCDVNSTRKCKCAELAGAQTCKAGGWDECVCLDDKNGGTVVGSSKTPQMGSSTPAGNLRADIRFDWERTEPVEGSCEPGYYEGDFQGLYASGLTVVNAPIPVFALGQPGRPGLSFTLEKSGNGEMLEVKNGKMDGVADGAFPFIGTLTGTLNCETLMFDLILDGYYSLGLDGIGKFKFKGPLLGGYDKVGRKVVDATWNVKEYDPRPTLDGAGGTGVWSAQWVPP
jgi:hypothetical protein